MRTFAPGKMVLSGAYAVLEGAPAIAVAVSRGAFADSSRAALTPTPEVTAALERTHEGVIVAPHTDASAMFVGSRKLGLGASAAILVASLGARVAEGGADLADPVVRDALFVRAREAHAEAQGGGSGVDVAVSVYGGTLRYVMGQRVRHVALPRGLALHVFACGTSARTSELRSEVDRLAKVNPALHRTCIGELDAIAREAAASVDRADADAFVGALRRTARGLARLGIAAQVPIVPAGFEMLEELAASERASFSVSGAGGGDVAVYVGPGAPSAAFLDRAHALGLFSLSLSLDTRGLRLAPHHQAAVVSREIQR
jgi:phosphomevalonate kinase